jgi:photosystem II stability/assembly factor-like uncharacterized protein
MADSWWRASLPGLILSVAASGSDLWAVTRGLSSSSEPPIWLYDSSDGGKVWRYRSTVTRVTGLAADLVRPGRKVGFALVQNLNGVSPPSAVILETTDAGLTWSKQSDPCNTTFADTRPTFTERLEGTSANSLWVLCGNEPGTQTQVKLVERSNDGGRTWTRVATAAPGRQPPLTMPYLGSLYRTGTSGNFVTTSSSDAWLLLNTTSTFLRTNDGGTTWEQAVPTRIENQFPQVFSIVQGIVFVRTQNALWSSREGGPWKLIAGSSMPY